MRPAVCSLSLLVQCADLIKDLLLTIRNHQASSGGKAPLTTHRQHPQPHLRHVQHARTAPDAAPWWPGAWGHAQSSGRGRGHQDQRRCAGHQAVSCITGLSDYHTNEPAADTPPSSWHRCQHPHNTSKLPAAGHVRHWVTSKTPSCRCCTSHCPAASHPSSTEAPGPDTPSFGRSHTTS
jgi:hypothetical protein